MINCGALWSTARDSPQFYNTLKQVVHAGFLFVLTFLVFQLCYPKKILGFNLVNVDMDTEQTFSVSFKNFFAKTFEF